MCVGLLLCPGPVVIGFAMYYFTYDPWIGKLLYLEDFFVMEEYRSKQNNYFPLLICRSLSSLTSNQYLSFSVILPPEIGIGSEILKLLSHVSNLGVMTLYKHGN